MTRFSLLDLAPIREGGDAAEHSHRLGEILTETPANEIILTAQIFDHAARLRSFEPAADILRAIK